MENNTFIGVTRPSDWRLGANSTLAYVPRNPSGSWEFWLPDLDFQKLNGFESDSCVPFSAVQSCETQINWLIKTGQVPKATMDWLTLNGYIEANGQFHASERFIAKLDGTNQYGTAMPAAWDAIRTCGLIPWKDWPFDQTITNWDQFFADIPQTLLDKGKLFLNYFSFAYEWLKDGGNGDYTALMKTHLQQAPLCLGLPVCNPWNQVAPPVCTGQPSAHSVMVYAFDINASILDHYLPFEKLLDAGYEIPFILKGVVSVIEPLPPLPININPTPKNVFILTQIVNLYTQLINLIKGRNNLGSISMNYSLLKSKTFWTIVLIFAYNGFTAISGNINPTYSVPVNAILGIIASYFHLQTGQSTTGTNS